MTSAPALGSWQVGATYSAVVVDNLTRSQIVQYAGASGDFNPIHTDEVYATAVAGLPGVFAHGMLTMGAAGALLQRVVGPLHLRSYTARFADRVWPGDVLTATVVVTAVTAVTAVTDDPDRLGVDLDLTVSNQDDVAVLRGRARAQVPANSSPGPSQAIPTRSENPRA